MSQKIPKKYHCGMCDYVTSSRKDFTKHESTRKHLRGKEYVKIRPESPYRCDCGRAYKHRGSLYNHRLKCSVAAKGIVAEQPAEDAEKVLLREHIAEMRELMKLMIPNIGNRVIKDNSIAVNVFLNETCKNAVNFDDFVDQISVSLDDLLLTKQIGYSQGVSNILIRNLNELEATDRPIHCSDQAKMRFYVKQMKGWNEEEGGAAVGTAITSITQKQIATIKTWEARYPEWHHHADQTEEYALMIRKVMGGSTDEEVERNRAQILKNVGGAVSLDKAISATPVNSIVNAALPQAGQDLPAPLWAAVQPSA
jgi:hypothetical protein